MSAAQPQGGDKERDKVGWGMRWGAHCHLIQRSFLCVFLEKLKNGILKLDNYQNLHKHNYYQKLYLFF